MNNPLTPIEDAITELEAERKSNPKSFFSAPGKPNVKDGPAYTKTMDLMARLQAFVNRLKAIQ